MDDGLFVSVLLVVFAYFIGTCAGIDSREASLQQEAVAAGAARYVVDQATGDVTFEWIVREGVEE